MDTPVKTILAATDLSRPAFAAVRRAALIARFHGAKLELLHVIPHSFGSTAWNEVRTTIGPVERELRQAADQSLDALVQQIEAEIGVRGNARATEGKPFAEITARSEVLDADLVVVGAHGENILLTPILGTTAHRVLRLARKPVLLVKLTPPIDDPVGSVYKHALITTDFEADSVEAARSARRLFPEMTATLFHAYEVPFEVKLARTIPEEKLEECRKLTAERAHDELEAFAAATQWSDAPRVVRHGTPGRRVREYATEVGADLIITGSEEVPRLHTALLGSVSLDLVTEAKCDVLLVRSAPAA
jgi:nucleotide-binding universal stress UspA family protein